ncbi:hypothetical protein LINGRAHAP2_LOCUS7922 [Linum grandiflorum]
MITNSPLDRCRRKEHEKEGKVDYWRTNRLLWLRDWVRRVGVERMSKWSDGRGVK